MIIVSIRMNVIEQNFLVQSFERSSNRAPLTMRVDGVALVIILTHRRGGTIRDRSIGTEVNWRHCVTLAFALSLSVALASPRAHAQAPARVGEAAVVQNEVLRVGGSGASQINVGDGLLRDEVVRTGADSAARLVMIDSTNLSLGANASIRLDRTVFNDEHSYKEIAIRLTTGAFRFVTGHSEKTAYKITTPLATIGVRGTTLDILSQNGKSTVVLQDGAAMVCTLSFQCIQLTQPGDTAIITTTGGKTTITKTSNSPWTFAQNCTAAAGLCTVTTFADAAPVDESDGLLCGR
jgi:ferric-dicitrate binding protein FerR (iron transport regulator)